MTQRTDEELLRSFAGGEAQAFAELFARHRGHLWAVALRVTADEADAADALQDGVLKAMRAAGGFQGRSQVSTWMHRIVTNAAIDIVRRRHPDLSLDESEENGLAAPKGGLAEPDWATALDVERALAMLPADQRVAVYLVDYEGWSVADAAAKVGVAQGTIKSRCSRGRARLAQVLAPGWNRWDAPDVQGSAARVTGGSDHD